MPRIRTLKPEHRQHRKVGPLSHMDYRLWVGMILEADDDGRLVCDPPQLAALIFGYHHEVTPRLIEDSLNTLARLGLIRMYAHNGTRYADFPSWSDHQRINRPTLSKLPSYADAVKDHGTLIEDSLLIGKEGKGRERKETKTGTPAKRSVLGDGEFLDALRKNPAYKRLDIDQELGMLDGWLLTPRGRGKQKTRGRIVAWLNRALQDLPLDRTPEKEEPYGFER